MDCGRVRLIGLICVLAAAALLHATTAEIYTVGTTEWSIPTTVGVYSTWAADKKFKVGDVLVFNFSTGVHDVTEVTKENYDVCGKSNPIATVTTGPANVNLTTAGMHYYICSFGQDCTAGQKLAIKVTQPGTRTPAATPPSTSTVSTTPTRITTISSPPSASTSTVSTTPTKIIIIPSPPSPRFDTSYFTFSCFFVVMIWFIVLAHVN